MALFLILTSVITCYKKSVSLDVKDCARERGSREASQAPARSSRTLVRNAG